MGEHNESGSEKKGRKVERSKRERERKRVDSSTLSACSLQFSQVSDRLFTLIRDPVGNHIFHRQKERDTQLLVQN